MIKSIIEDVRRQFSFGNVVTRLVIINVAVFVAVNLFRLTFYLFNAGVIPPLYQDFLHFFSVSSSLMHNLTHPWVFVTSIFLHESFWHLLWNMLFLYWFGRIVGDMIGDRKVFPIYLLGGIVGCIAFWGSAQLIPYFGEGVTGYALGASGGVMAIVVAAGMIAPDYIMTLLFIGDVRLKFIVAALVLLDLFALGGPNTGGHFAHLGGIFMGWLFVYQLQNGRDLSIGINSAMDKIQSYFESEKVPVRKAREARMVVKRNYKKTTTSEVISEDEIQERVDNILEKIKQKGYEQLTQEEKEFLNKASSR